MELDNRFRARSGKVTVTDLLIWCFAFWPLFWNLWVNIRITYAFSSALPVYLLMGGTFAALLMVRKFRKSSLFAWMLFLIAITISGTRGIKNVARIDIIVIFCGILFCMCMQNIRVKPELIIRCLYGCGLFVAISIILDAITHIFQTSLLSIFTDYGQSIILSMRLGGIATGGILPHTGNAGCFICAGIAAYIALLRFKGKKLKIGNWIIIAIFIVSFLFLQKRGFLLDMIIAVFIIWICGWRFEKAFRVDLRKQLRVAVTILLFVVISIVLYSFVPYLRGIFDALIARFSKEDVTMNGRTTLYALAYRLFQTNPIWGIGWGNYRPHTLGIFWKSSLSTYEVHNVYLQVLCETGIVGFVTFIIGIVSTLGTTIRRYRQYLIRGEITSAFRACQLGLYLQLFFLAYCFSGNPLYDYNFLITYFVGVLLSVVNSNESMG